MSALTGEGAPRGNEILSNSVIGNLEHISNLTAVILAKEKLKENDWNVFADIFKVLLHNTEEMVTNWALKGDVNHSELNEKQVVGRITCEKSLKVRRDEEGLKEKGVKQTKKWEENWYWCQWLMPSSQWNWAGDACFSHRPEGGGVLQQIWFPVLFKHRWFVNIVKTT